MKKRILKSGLLAIVGTGLMVGTAIANPLNNGPSLISDTSTQTPLQGIVDVAFAGSTNIPDVYNDQTGVGVWQHAEADSSTYSVAFQFGTSEPSSYQYVKVGIYDFVTEDEHFLFDSTQDGISFRIKADGTLKVGSFTVDNGWSGAFGFYAEIDGSKFYTEDLKNGGGNYAASYLLESGTKFDGMTFLGDNDWLLAFDFNGDDGSLRDFNDAVFVVEDMASVPEPATMLLFGAGLAGLAGARRKRDK